MRKEGYTHLCWRSSCIDTTVMGTAWAWGESQHFGLAVSNEARTIVADQRQLCPELSLCQLWLLQQVSSITS